MRPGASRPLPKNPTEKRTIGVFTARIHEAPGLSAGASSLNLLDNFWSG